MTAISLTRAKEGSVVLPIAYVERNTPGVTLSRPEGFEALVGPVAHAHGVSVAAVLKSIPPSEVETCFLDFQDNPDSLVWWVKHKVPPA